MTRQPYQHLLITADDCGLSEGINIATAELASAGIINVASIMTNFAATRHAFATLRDFHHLDTGVHLNLSDGTPLTRLPRSSALIGADGQFGHQMWLYALAVAPSPRLRQQMRAELSAQIDFFARYAQPRHLTTHCHFHVFPALRAIVYELAEEYGVEWVRGTSYRKTAVPYNPVFRPSRPDYDPHPFVVPDYLVGLRQWLRQPPHIMVDAVRELMGLVEIIVHPGQAPDPAYPADVRYSPLERERETDYLREWHTLFSDRLNPSTS